MLFQCTKDYVLKGQGFNPSGGGSYYSVEVAFVKDKEYYFADGGRAWKYFEAGIFYGMPTEDLKKYFKMVIW